MSNTFIKRYLLKSSETLRVSAILRTHGGLGNQIFQVLYGRLFSEKYGLKLKEVHDTHYKHHFPRSSALRMSSFPLTKHEKILAAMRLPKLFQRITMRSVQSTLLFGTAYLDGYFQDRESYNHFDSFIVKRHLLQLGSELLIKPAHIDQCLVHLRVGDFFISRKDAKDHVVQRLSKIKSYSSIITNDEKLLTDSSIASLLSKKHCTLISTVGFSAERVLQLMSTYRRIDANDSTLVFWASVLGGSQTELRHVGLKDIQEYFLRCMRYS